MKAVRSVSLTRKNDPSEKETQLMLYLSEEDANALYELGTEAIAKGCGLSFDIYNNDILLCKYSYAPGDIGEVILGMQQEKFAGRQHSLGSHGLLKGNEGD